MSKLAECLQENKRESLKIVDTCSECRCNIYFGEVYYDIYGKIICQDCIEIFKKKEVNEFE